MKLSRRAAFFFYQNQQVSFHIYSCKNCYLSISVFKYELYDGSHLIIFNAHFERSCQWASHGVSWLRSYSHCFCRAHWSARASSRSSPGHIIKECCKSMWNPSSILNSVSTIIILNFIFTGTHCFSWRRARIFNGFNESWADFHGLSSSSVDSQSWWQDEECYTLLCKAEWVLWISLFAVQTNVILTHNFFTDLSGICILMMPKFFSLLSTFRRRMANLWLW